MTGGLRRAGIVGLLVLPLVVGGVLMWALGSPTSDLERVPAAIVNDDEPVTLDGQTVPLGRELAAILMAGEEPPAEDAGPTVPALGWVLTNAGDAAAGLAEGRYVAVVTIPSSFSADATSISGPGAQARPATVDVQTTASSAWLDPALTGAVTDAATAALGRELTSRYLGQVYDGFNEIAAQIGDAASGAAQLADGASSAAEGAAALATGAGDLASGLTALDEGAAQLSEGLQALTVQSAPLAGLAADVSRGADEVARTIGEASRRTDVAVAEFAVIVDELCDPSRLSCDRARQALTTLEGIAEQLRALTEATRRVAVGDDALAAALPRVIVGIGEAADGGASLAAGAAASDAGGEAVSQGAAELAAGTSQVDAGATQLADGLGSATASLPTYTDADIATLSTVVAQPVVSRADSTMPGFTAAPIFAMIALWFGAIATSLFVPAVPRRWLLTGRRSMRITGEALAPLAALGAAQGIVVTVAVLPGSGASPIAWVGFAGVGALTGAVFTLVCAGLVAVLGGVGRLVAVLVGVVALSAALSSTVPPLVAGLAGTLPTAAAAVALRAPLTGIATGFAGALAGLALAGILGAVLVFAGVVRHRVREAASTD